MHKSHEESLKIKNVQLVVNSMYSVHGCGVSSSQLRYEVEMITMDLLLSTPRPCARTAYSVLVQRVNHGWL